MRVLNVFGSVISKSFVPFLLCLSIAVPSIAQAKAASQHPTRGMTMKAVEKQLGKPKAVRKSQGAVKKQWPRITAWNYGRFTVYFERQRVLHTVAH